MPSSFSPCLPVAANSAGTTSPTFQPWDLATLVETRIPSVPRVLTEPEVTPRSHTLSIVRGFTEVYALSEPPKRAMPQPTGETTSTPGTSATAGITDGLKPSACALD